MKIIEKWLSNKVLIIWLIVTIFFLTFLFIVFRTNTFYGTTLNHVKASDYGSFIGGIITPYFTFTAAILYLASIYQNRNIISRNEINGQIDSRLKHHNLIISELEIAVYDKKGKFERVIRGRKVLHGFMADFGMVSAKLLDYLGTAELDFGDIMNISFLVTYFGGDDYSLEQLKPYLNKYSKKIQNQVIDIVKNTYYSKSAEGFEVLIGHQQMLGRYFRNLYQTYRMIYLENDNTFKVKYRRLLRTHLSVIEQALIVLNSMSDLGRLSRDDKGIDYLTELEVIKNIPRNFIANINLETLFPKVKFEFLEVIEKKGVGLMFNELTNEHRTILIDLFIHVKKKRLSWYSLEQFEKLRVLLQSVYGCMDNVEINHFIEGLNEKVMDIGFKRKASKSIVRDFEGSIDYLIEKKTK